MYNCMYKYQEIDGGGVGMSPQKFGGVVMILIGVAIVLMALSVEFIGLGGGDGIGWVQLLVAGSGLVFVVGGFYVYKTPEY